MEKDAVLMGRAIPSERIRAVQTKGRKHYIFYRGVLGWGMPMFALTTFRLPNIWSRFFKSNDCVLPRTQATQTVLLIPLINDFVLIRNNEEAGLRLRGRQILRHENLLSALGSINDRDQIDG